MEPTRRSRWARRLFVGGAVVLATFALLEGGLAALRALDYREIPGLRRSESDFWDGAHPDFGVWRHPNASFVHVTPCFRATYETNSMGARDVERSLRSEAPRVVVLGDSFTAGWGLPVEQRLSNRLEAITGIEHLNFAMPHFSPYQQALVYRTLARRYRHDAVLATVVPYNDFTDLDYEQARQLPDFAIAYRPYLLRENGGFAHFDHRESPLARLLRRHSHTYSALAHLKSLVEGRREFMIELSGRAWFYDFEEEQYAVLERSLELLAEEVGDRPLAVLLIPSLADLKHYDFLRSGADPLQRRLEAFAERRGVRIVNLLPPMHRYTQHWARYFFSCDYHWSAYGNEVALRFVREALGEGFYPGGAVDGEGAED